MNSLPSTEAANLESYWDVIRRLDPELFLIKIALEETGVNPIIIPKFIRALANLAYGTGYGRVQVFMQNGVVTQIKPEESNEVNVKTITVREEVII